MTESLSPPTSPPSAKNTHLRRGSLGVADIVFFVVAAAAPLTVMAGVAPLAILLGGIGAPAAYFAIGVLLCLFAVGFTAMTPYIRNAGAFYSYVTRGFGRPVGLGAALLAVFSYNALQIGLYGAFGFLAGTTVNNLFGLDVPWPVYAFAGIVLVWYLGYRSVHFGAKVLAVILVVEVAILSLLAAGILFHGGAEGLSMASFSPRNVFAPGMGAALGIAVAAFIGFEATAIYRVEARNPDRTVPRATYIAVVFLGLFYCFITWVIVQAFGNEGAVAAAAENPAEMFFTAMTQYVGGWATVVQRVLLLASVLGALLALHNNITRYVHTLASERALPTLLGRIHPRHGSPWVTGVAQSALAAVVVTVFAVIGVHPYGQFFLWVNSPGVVGILALQAMAAFAVVAFFRRTTPAHGEGRFRTLIAPMVAGVLMTAILVLVCWNLDLFTGAGPVVNGALVVLTLAVFGAGVLLARRLRRTRPHVYAGLATTDIETT